MYNLTEANFEQGAAENAFSPFHITAELVMGKVNHLMKDLDSDQRLNVYLILQEMLQLKVAALRAPVDCAAATPARSDSGNSPAAKAASSAALTAERSSASRSDGSSG